MSKHVHQTIRELGYRSCIPYYILFDPDLTIQHMRLYSLIEQMESNPNPNVAPTFSYGWFASILGIKSRGAMKIAKLMKDKGYLIHTQKTDGHWIWGTAKKMVIDDSDNQAVFPQGGVSSEDTHPLSTQDTPPVSYEDTQKTNKIKDHKDKLTTTTKKDVVVVDILSKTLTETEKIKLSDAFENNPIQSTYIKNLDDFLSAALFSILNREPNITRRQRLHGIINLVNQRVFEEPALWANIQKKEQIKKPETKEEYNARIARYMEENKRNKPINR